MKERNFFTLLFKLSLILLLLLTSCSQPSETPQPTTAEPATLAVTQPAPAVTSPTPTEAPPPSTVTPTTPPAISAPGLTCVQTDDGNELTQPGQLTASPFFINGQVILIGPAESVKQAAQQLGDSLTPLVNCTFTLPDQLVQIFKDEIEYPLPVSTEAQPQGPPLPGVLPAVEMEMNLYQFTQGNLQEIFKKLNAFPDVFADPNYLVGGSARSACGEPNGVAGHPFSIEGSPFSIEGSPYGGAALPALPQAFWEQWAFNQMNITNPGNSLTEKDGKGVRIAIFDTSPYRLETGIAQVTEPVISPTLVMTVHHPLDLFAIPPNSSLTNIVDVSGHGLFVASLAHAVAPGSQIDLYRVLDQFGCGDLFHLNSAMLDFISSKLDEKDFGAALKRPAVMNLSLGVLKPRQLPENIKIENIDEAVREAYNIVIERGNSIASLSFITRLAYQVGIVVVAAAGNDSLPDQTFPMELPAAYSSVIGVSASTKDRLLACYSNAGDVIAPGAEADTDIDHESGEKICMPLTEKCPAIDATATPGSCEYGVVGLFKPLDKDQRDFAYWVGTSFATPLISGKAALRYAITGNRDQVYTDIVSKFPYP
jgi:hypothetical protein